MLQVIRDRAQGVIAWIIIILIVVPFALWGINEYIQDDTVLLAAKVDDVEVPLQDFQRSYQNERNLRKRMLGNNFDPSQLDDAEVKQTAIERLVNATLLAKSATDAGFVVSNAQLAMDIRNMREFQVNDRFDQARYASLLQSLGLSQAGFERELRQQFLTEELMSGINEGEFVLAKEAEAYGKLNHQRRSFDYLVIPAKGFEKRIQVSEADIKAAYDQDQERYKTPEQVTVSFIELSRQALARKIPAPSDDVLKQLYADRQAEFGQPEQRHAHHILIEVAKDADEATVEKARKKAEALRKKILGGASFEKVARKESADTGSAQSGGDLGFFERGMMTKPFEDAVFSMAKGDLSEPVRSEFGFHVIRLDDVKKAAVKPFEEVRGRLLRDYRSSKAEDEFFENADRLTDLVYEHPDTLEIAAKELGLEIQTSEPFTRDRGIGVADEAAVRAAAFSSEVLTQGNNSEALQLDGGNRLVVLRVKHHEPSHQQDIKEVSAEIRKALVAKEAGEQAGKKGAELVKSLRDGAAPKTVAKEMGQSWQASGLIRRNSGGVPDAVRERAFTMAKPAKAGSDVVGGVALNDGGYALIRLHTVDDTGSVDKKPGQTDADVVAETLRQRQADQNALRSSWVQRENAALLDGLKERAKIVIYNDNL
ncbi:MAG: hypothetical protein GC138_03770 [Gammaproteobacteria bacterium]|nr:hypothetical protein [Gammaproteobacteria bacterium]